SACALGTCGDGGVAPTEACDDGNQENTDTCTSTCTDAACGDGFVQGDEACDAEADNSNNASCTLLCQENVCGDGLVFNATGDAEECDNRVENGPGQACDAMCVANACGDGDLGPDEQCDDGNADPGDGCTASCELEDAGGRRAVRRRQRDAGDGCSATCQLGRSTRRGGVAGAIRCRVGAPPCRPNQRPTASPGCHARSSGPSCSSDRSAPAAWARSGARCTATSTRRSRSR
ncbi:MAG TPA: DUF4215 domain-containing protein, partial [Nannocystis sp.]